MDPGTQTPQASEQPPEHPPGGADYSGRTLGDFQLLRRLGQGGMGQVYLAAQTSLKRNVAVKIMRTDVVLSATSLQRFRAEAEAVARLTHANIVQVYAFGEENGLHYMALEYVEGRNLREYLDKKGSPELPLALSILRQTAAALQRASEVGVIHRDIKPENILLTRRGEVKVADFGLARCFAGDQPAPNLTQSGMTLGTPLYMSPEQVQGEQVDPRTDIYSLGVTSYHMLAGRPPFFGCSAFELALHHVQTQPAPLSDFRPDLPPELCSLVHKMMAKKREDRHANGAELLRDLARLRDTLAGSKSQVSGTLVRPLPSLSAVSAVGAAPSRRRQRWLVGLVALSILLALFAGGGLAWWRDRSPVSALPAPAAEESIAPVLTEQQKQEKFLRDAVEQYANPGSDRMRLDLGVRHCLELGLFYLKHNRIDDAERFFAGLIDSSQKVEAYRTLGRLGRAIVLARRDRPAESNQAFLELLNERPPKGRVPDRLPFLLNQPQLRYEIGKALDHNQANAPHESLPPRLKELRDPPRASSAAGKTAEKNP